jgi:hypothetical protein
VYAGGRLRPPGVQPVKQQASGVRADGNDMIKFINVENPGANRWVIGDRFALQHGQNPSLGTGFPEGLGQSLCLWTGAADQYPSTG